MRSVEAIWGVCVFFFFWGGGGGVGMFWGSCGRGRSRGPSPLRHDAKLKEVANQMLGCILLDSGAKIASCRAPSRKIVCAMFVMAEIEYPRREAELRPAGIDISFCLWPLSWRRQLANIGMAASTSSPGPQGPVGGGARDLCAVAVIAARKLCFCWHERSFLILAGLESPTLCPAQVINAVVC